VLISGNVICFYHEEHEGLEELEELEEVTVLTSCIYYMNSSELEILVRQMLFPSLSSCPSWSQKQVISWIRDQ
jgi:hypothetical protein